MLHVGSVLPTPGTLFLVHHCSQATCSVDVRRSCVRDSIVVKWGNYIFFSAIIFCDEASSEVAGFNSFVREVRVYGLRTELRAAINHRPKLCIIHLNTHNLFLG